MHPAVLHGGESRVYGESLHEAQWPGVKQASGNFDNSAGSVQRSEQSATGSGCSVFWAVPEIAKA